MTPRPEHRPDGDPCTACGLAPSKHRAPRPTRTAPSHAPDGDPCSKCGLPEERHRKPDARRARARQRTIEAKEQRKKKYAEENAEKRRIKREERNSAPIVGIDGEGKGRDPHVYTYLAAVNEHGDKLASIEAQEGLATLDILNMLVDLADEHGVKRVFGYSLGYDFSMMLRDLPNDALWVLVRPESRARQLESGRTVHRPVYWRGFKLTYMRRRLGIQRITWDEKKQRSVPASKAIVVWDVFAFYQGKFTKALADWKTIDKAVIDRIAKMKDQRSAFDTMGPKDVQDYCDDECKLLGKLVRQLIEAHETANLPLESFYGAGSTASVLLSRMGVRTYKVDPPADMAEEIARAFGGGRFEVRHIGPVAEDCYNHDISSCYPYQLYRMPCLACGKWKKVAGSPKDIDRAVRKAQLALVHCAFKKGAGSSVWGPFPFRFPRNMKLAPGQDMHAGTIVFPLCSIGSWVWREEYLAAKDTLWPGIQPIHAWIYETPCDHKPFGELPEIYRQRCLIGKDGPGIVLKLGPNSCYGKCAQSVGAAPYRSLIWAGCTTSNARGQLLRAVASAKDPRNILMLATDGIIARERLSLPAPEDTGTGPDVLRDEKGNVKNAPLGGWEITPADEPLRGVFLAKAGIYWDKSTSRDKIKARGISRVILYDHAEHVEAHFRTKGWQVPYMIDGACKTPGCGYRHRPDQTSESAIRVATCRCEDPECTYEPHAWRKICPKCRQRIPPPVVRFVGVRQGITCGFCPTCGKQRPKCPPSCGPDGGGRIKRSRDYGEWIEWPLEVSFNPFPKRGGVMADGQSLAPWLYSPSGGYSAPYNKAFPGLEALRMIDYQDKLADSGDDLTLA